MGLALKGRSDFYRRLCQRIMLCGPRAPNCDRWAQGSGLRNPARTKGLKIECRSLNNQNWGAQGSGSRSPAGSQTKGLN